MSFAAIIGMDIIIASNNLKFEFGSQLTVSSVAQNNVTDFNEILHVDFSEGSEAVGNALQINPLATYVDQDRVRKVFDTCYVNNTHVSSKDAPLEMKIILKHHQPISCRPRRLSFVEKGKL